jgi:hypothetical protein
MKSKEKEINPIPKVVIGLACTDEVYAQTAQAIAGAVIGAKGMVIDVILRKSCEIASARTWLVNQAISAGATHLLFVDSDMVFPYEVIPQLLAHKKDIIGVEYNRRKFPLEGTSKPLTEAKTDEIYQAQYVGTGCMLIDLSIFKSEWKDGRGNKTPWFNFGRDSQGNLALGEDAWFCFTAKDNGFETWVEPTIKVGHLGMYMY